MWRLGLFERPGFLGSRRVKVQVVWTLEKQFPMCAHTYTLRLPLLEDKRGERNSTFFKTVPAQASKEIGTESGQNEVTIGCGVGERLEGL